MERFRRNHEILRTPSGSGQRTNPFDSQGSTDMLQYPTFSPSVFSTVVSPSQDSLDGRFWSVDQQAMLFPANISDDSPWKQEAALSRLDPESENRTQEAIDLYFSRFSHQITSPEDSVMASRSLMLSNRTTMMSQGGSPNLTSSAMASMCATPVAYDISMAIQKPGEPQPSHNQGDFSKVGNLNGKRLCSQWSQTELTFPPKLSDDMEAMIAQFCTFKDDQSVQSKVSFTQSNATNSQPQTSFHMEDSNNSTLRRKLFAGFEDSDDSSVESEKHGNHNSSRIFDVPKEEDDKENVDVSKLIVPGTILFTPTSNKKHVSPNHSLCWSLSPVSRKKPLQEPLGSSTPTKAQLF